eukprot:scaffold3577_cov262-Chaetoceros_neogracile.AAC.1
MKTSIVFLAALAISGAQAFAPASKTTFTKPSALSMAKYNSMDEILAKFPEDMPTLINFYDAKTEADIKSDIVRAKNLLKDRCTVVSIKQQDYPELAKKWDADEKSPSMILFMDGNPLTRIYEETFYLDIVAKVGKYCRPAGEEHKELK